MTEQTTFGVNSRIREFQIAKQLLLNSSGDFCHLQIHVTFVKNLDPDQARQNVGPDLDSNCLTP